MKRLVAAAIAAAFVLPAQAQVVEGLIRRALKAAGLLR